MSKFLKSLPIFRRLFLAFFLAVVIPDLIIIAMGGIYTQVLNRHGIGSAETGPLLLGTVIALLISTGIVILLGSIVNVTITEPLRQLVALTRRIREGDTQARATITGRDEIAIVAIAMNSMLENIVQLIQVTQHQHDHLQSQVEKLVSEVSGVGEGDLRIQAEVTSDTLGVLADSFNYMVEELSTLVVRVKMVAQEVGSAAITTRTQMAELVSIADIQLQYIASAAQQIEQMAQASRRATHNVQTLNEAASEARLSVQNGLTMIQRTVAAMGRINVTVQESARQAVTLDNRSCEIDEIVNVISGIANSTNRLALDAAIQATMAGENGKGFLAVADGIRRLAEQAKVQAGLISQVIRGVREDIGITTLSMRETAHDTSEGAALIQETGSALQKIYVVVERQASELDTISQEAHLLLQSANSVVQMMQNVSRTTLQSSKSTRKVAQHMEILLKQSGQLMGSVEAFKLRQDAMSALPQLALPEGVNPVMPVFPE